MRAWTPYISQKDANIVLPSPANPSYPLEFRSQIVTLLAGMIILSQQLEVVS
jgi:hypothetical protein